MVSPIQANGSTIDTLFDPWIVGTKAALTGIQENGTDVANTYQALAAGGSARAAVGIKYNGTDLASTLSGKGTTSTTRLTSWTTTYTTTFTTTFPTSQATTKTTSKDTLSCILRGTMVRMDDGRRVPAEDLSKGDQLLSVELPGLQPETIADYEDYVVDSLAEASLVTTEIVGIQEAIVNYLFEIDLGNEIIARVTPEHPFLVFTEDGRYIFKAAIDLKANDCLVSREFGKLPIQSRRLLEGEFSIFKIDCAPYDIFIHDDIVAHNAKLHQTTIVTSFATAGTTTWNTSRSTSNTTSKTTSVNTTVV